MERNAKIFVAGHRGMVGSAIERKLEAKGYSNVVTRGRESLDLRDGKAVREFFLQEQFDYVFLAAAKVGGILANRDRPGDFIRDNLFIQMSVIDAAYQTFVKKLLFLGSSCIYPKHAPQPLKEEYLLTGELETTNEAYAIAKIAGIKMCQAYNRQFATTFISAMPTNLYGDNDNFDPLSSHVLPALIRKMHEAKEHEFSYVEIWGSGKPYREFLHADDLADACVFLMETYTEGEIVNVGSGKELAIRELAELVRAVVGYEGELRFNAGLPDGTPRKLLDCAKLNRLGWKSSISLREGIERTYTWYLNNIAVRTEERRKLS
ncbi:GDP-L-fucose synthase family protein [Paenibacillaceae bacterium WGS1546]|uniref:GDP-L-fucose synthase family protein n=1 Tax=Cohnella sp. WGS1546 TaxID=3366810 RepID=UPI00372D5490